MILDIPNLAKAVLKQYALERVDNELDVAWYSDGVRRSATYRPDKYIGAWLVYTIARSGGAYESYYPKAYVVDEIKSADAVEVMSE